jgi:hypothetical protein
MKAKTLLDVAENKELTNAKNTSLAVPLMENL